MWKPFYKMKPTKCTSALRRGIQPFIGDSYFFDRDHFLYRCGVLGTVDIKNRKITPASWRSYTYLMWIERACFCPVNWSIKPSRHLIVVKSYLHRGTVPESDLYKWDKWLGLESMNCVHIGHPLYESRPKALKYAQSLEVDTTIKYLLDSEDHRLIDHALWVYNRIGE